MSVLVVGANGQQGGAVTRALLAAGVAVRGLVRDPAKGVPGTEVAVGDLEDRDSLAEAVRGASAVFSMQMPPLKDGTFDFDGELRQAVNLIEAARAAGVRHFVHSSVSGSRRLPAEERWAPMRPYYAAKAGVEDRVKEAGFEFWTLIRPGFFMENFLPSAAYLLPRGLEGGIVTTLKPGTWLSLVAVDDIGAAVAAAVTDPYTWNAVELELAGDHLPLTAIAWVMGMTAPDMSEQEALAAGMPAYAVLSNRLMNEVPQPARPEFARALGVPLTPFARWASEKGGIRG
ncbi:NmrA family NAD(P)-binding protein [Actinoplanes sp. NPDC048988]|uniref:NmrA family NAD(P)-binding protein n=1 Tax=Actinoplanes sp. NPDC048988 TaxID=3363901 RepID=UPI003722D764